MKRIKLPNRYIAILLIALFLFFVLNDAAYAGRTQVTVSIAFGTVIAGAIGLSIYISMTRVSLMEGIKNETLFDFQKRSLLTLENGRFRLQIPSVNIEADEPSPFYIDILMDKTPPAYSASVLEIKF